MKDKFKIVGDCLVLVGKRLVKLSKDLVTPLKAMGPFLKEIGALIYAATVDIIKLEIQCFKDLIK